MSKEKRYEGIYVQAQEAGLKALREATPRPIVVGQAVGLSDEIDYSKEVYHVPEGVCGFAWINIKPGTSRFARWLKKEGLARKDSYYGGVTIWVSEGGQSYERKMAFARAFESVLEEHGIRANAGGRLD